MRLRSWKLPESNKFSRVPPEIAVEEMGSDFKQRYDFKTFVYHAFSVKDYAVLICPKFRNLEHLLMATKFYADGVASNFSIRRSRQHDEVIVRGENIKELRLTNEVDDMRFDLSNAQHRIFDGLNTIVTINRNGHLDWIRDFVDYHEKYHNAQALLLFDNNSSEFTLDSLDEIMVKTKLRAWKVVSADFPYGPVLKNRDQSLQYLQGALLSAARQDFLRGSAGVLSIDVDELLMPSTVSVFVEARASMLGMIRFPGVWRFTPHCEDSALFFHRDHYMRPFEEHWSPHKYCYVPGRLASRLPFDAHGIAIDMPVIRKILHASMLSSNQRYWHCSGLTTSWKGPRASSREDLVEDKAFKTMLRSDQAKDSLGC